MMRLLRIEFARLRWRRATLLLLAVAVAVPIVILGVTAWTTRPMTSSEADAAHARVEQERKDPSYARDLHACLDDPASYGLEPSEADHDCPTRTLPQVSWYFYREPLRLVEQREQSGIAMVVVLVAALLLTGATFAGHDWSTGSIANQLLIEPRRPRVWIAKALVVTVAGLVLAVIVLSAFWTGLWLIAEQRGLAPTRAELVSVYLVGARGSLVVAGAGLLGYAATILLRSTVATLGLVFAFSVLAPVVLGVGDFKGSDRLMPQQNFMAIALGGVVIDDFGDNCAAGVSTPGKEGLSCSTHISTGEGVGYYGVILLGISAASIVVFSRRDMN